MAAAALLFDLDGTLCDSRSWYVDLLAACGVHRVAARVALERGESVIALARAHRVRIERLASLCAERGSERLLYPGVSETLARIASGPAPIGLVTSLSGKMANVVLEVCDLRKYFGAVVTPWWGMRPKPHPESLLRALASLGLVASADIYYVGDLTTDAEAAAAAGVSFAWASYGYGNDVPAGSAAVLKSFPEVLQL